jgi:NADPH-dependent 2,4-dienoyl-CoA reductase/sulfur reductase-like enzyme
LCLLQFARVLNNCTGGGIAGMQAARVVAVRGHKVDLYEKTDYDPANEVTMEDATQLLAFVQELMKYLYELPAELQRCRNS